MRTLNTKVLPVMRVLLQKCNEAEQAYFHLENGNHEIAVKRLGDSNPLFEFYELSDTKLLARIAVLKANRDSIVPYQYWDDEKDLPVKMVEFNSDGFMYFKGIEDQYYQRVFCSWTTHWINILNEIHRFV